MAQMKKYLITSPDLYTSSTRFFRERVSQKIEQHHVEYILFRDKENDDYHSLAKDFVEVCSSFAYTKCFLHQDALLAHTLGATGVHLTSLQFGEIAKAKELGLEVIVSTHTHDEVLEAQRLGADAVTYSPIFFSPGKGEPKGIEDLEELLKKCTVKVFALGGVIDDSQVKKIAGTDAYGFASIRYFFT